MFNSNKVLLFGAGFMGKEYAKVLKAQNINFTVIGRSKTTADIFEKEFEIPVIRNGLKGFLQNHTISSYNKAIVAISEEEAPCLCLELLDLGIKSILVEKPAALTKKELQNLYIKEEEINSKVFVAYNRRFFSSTKKAQEIISNDGGITSFQFEFTEWSHRLKDAYYPPKVKRNWLLTNSSHVIDHAFFLGGNPEIIHCFTSGGLDWHPSGSIFTGAGKTKKGSIFSYSSNWEAPGRWSVEMMTKKHRLIFRPMEKLQQQEIGKTEAYFIETNDKYDLMFKPGLYLQTKAFLDNDFKDLQTIKGQLELINIYQKINGNVFS